MAVRERREILQWALVTIYQILLTVLDSTLRGKRRKAEQQALGPLKLQLNHRNNAGASCSYTEEIQAQTSLHTEEEAGPSEWEAGPEKITPLGELQGT